MALEMVSFLRPGSGLGVLRRIAIFGGKLESS